MGKWQVLCIFCALTTAPGVVDGVLPAGGQGVKLVPMRTVGNRPSCHLRELARHPVLLFIIIFLVLVGYPPTNTTFLLALT